MNTFCKNIYILVCVKKQNWTIVRNGDEAQVSGRYRVVELHMAYQGYHHIYISVYITEGLSTIDIVVPMA